MAGQTDIVRSVKEMILVRDMHLNRPESSLSSYVHPEILLQRLWKLRRHIRVYRSDDGIHSAAMFVPNTALHSVGVELHQQYCTTDRGGYRALKELLALHETFREIGIKEKYHAIVTTCSPLDTSMTLTRYLEYHGWQRWGYMARWETAWPAGTQVAPAGTQVVAGRSPRPRLGSPSGSNGAAPPTGR